MRQYHGLLRDILKNGDDGDDRTGVGTRSVFGRQVRFDLQKGFPLLTTKKLHTRSIFIELLWMIHGETNNNWLKAHHVGIWNEWAAEDGSLGPVYGEQWRAWKGADGTVHDQLAQVIKTIRTNPKSRRMVVSAWNVGELDRMALAPCHCLFQFYVSKGKLSCQLYQRSADIFLGVPFNIASYALLTSMVAQICGLEPGEFVHTFGDLHLYNNHFEQAELLLSRNPRKLPTLTLNLERREIDDFKYEDITIHGYNPHPHIKAEVAV